MITKKEYEEAVKICDAYHKQLIDEIHRKNIELSKEIKREQEQKFIIAVSKLTPSSCGRDLRDIDIHLSNVLSKCLGNAPISHVLNYSEDYIERWCDNKNKRLGKRGVEKIKHILAYVGLGSESDNITI